ncbi:MAG: AbrB/MazE/SpoVT family DNA-binding domain-containing protein [Halococcoides sp.]
MSQSENSTESETEVVAVTKHGQATIPKRFREKLGIEAPGTVRFREREGSVVVEAIRSPSEMRGFAARQDSDSDRPATDFLREKRERDRTERDRRVENGE